jgi:UDP-N-acetylglucosamine:LPS N-acetylglucosamine transferase
VTFAGSPDRAEARLVPDAGFELDPFRVEGLPREPSLRQIRAVALAGQAPVA